MTKLRVLLLDDEPEILKALTRVLRGKYDIETFTNGNDALAAMETKLFSILVSDMRMPEMDGATFLAKAHQLNPISQKILLTGYSDPEDTSKAINQGNIDFYLNKPWDNDELIGKLEVCAENFGKEYKRRSISKQVKVKNQQLQSNIKKNEQALADAENKSEQSLQRLRKYYQQFIEMMSQCIQLHCQDEFAHGERIASQVKFLSQLFKGTPLLSYQSSVAARLYELGKMQLPQEILFKTEVDLKLEEKRQLMLCPEMSASMLSHFPEFAAISKITRHVQEHFDGTGLPQGLSGDDIPPPSQWILVCSLYDNLITGKTMGTPLTPTDALELLKEEHNEHIRPPVMSAFTQMIQTTPSSEELPIEFAMNARQLSPGMKLARDLPLESAKSNLLNKEHVLTRDNVTSLKNMEETKSQPLIVFVYPHVHQAMVPKENTSEQEAEG